MSNSESIEDTGFKAFFNQETTTQLAHNIKRVYQPFSVEDYVSLVTPQLVGKELKDRILVMAQELRKMLPDDYPTAVDVLVRSLRPELQDGEGMYNNGWGIAPIARFVEEFGVEYPRESLAALQEITQRHTAEFALRPLLERHYDLTMDTLTEWTGHESEHVRRAASEGSRPALPWARKLTRFVEDPTPLFELLDPLKDDPSRYVQKSVANSLNDVTKYAPEQVLEVLIAWNAASPTENTQWITKHALRTLVKKGHVQALQMVGVTGGEHLELVEFNVQPSEIALGETVMLSAVVHNRDLENTHRVIIDAVVHLRKKNGQSIPKVFKMSTGDIPAGKSRRFLKRLTIKPVTTRVYYSGTHVVELQINGERLAEGSFELTV